jgi:hypothetical protein
LIYIGGSEEHYMNEGSNSEKLGTWIISEEKLNSTYGLRDYVVWLWFESIRIELVTT